MGSTKFTWNDAALGRIVGKSPESIEAVADATTRIGIRATAMGAGFRTGIWHDPLTHERRGGTAPKYESSSEVGRHAVHGIVYTGNYSAMKDNAQNNTLLKSIG